MPVKLWGMRVRASARILKKGVQDNLMRRWKNTEEPADFGRTIVWLGANIQAETVHISLEQILAAMGQNNLLELGPGAANTTDPHSKRTRNKGTR